MDTTRGNDYEDPMISINYEKWVDNIIETHKTRLNELKYNRNSDSKQQISSQIAKNNLENSPKHNTDTSSNLLIHYDQIELDEKKFPQLEEDDDNKDNIYHFKQNKMNNLINSYMDENAQMKLRIKDMEEIITQLRKESLENRKQIVKNSDIFLKREKNLTETINLLEFENKRLKEKIKEFNSELEKNRKENLFNISENKACKCINGYPYSEQKSLVFISDDKENLDLKCFRLDKIVEIFLSFFEKYQILKNIREIVKIFDYQGIKRKLDEFDNFVKNRKDFIKEENLATSEMERCIDKGLGLNSSPQNKVLTLNSSEKLKTEPLLTNNENNLFRSKCNKHSEIDLFSGLDHRLTQLENSFMNFYMDKTENKNFIQKTKTKPISSQPATKGKNKIQEMSISTTTKKKNVVSNFTNNYLSNHKLKGKS